MWTQTLSISPYASRHAQAIDLGVEPAIEVDGERHTFFDHRRVSLRWLSGTVLVGLMGAALIGATIYAALDREANFAEAPHAAMPVKKESAEVGLNPRKGDRLVKPIDIVAAKQEYRVAMPTKIGDKEVLRAHVFDRVETTLLTATAGFADEVPPFNPLKVLADARAAPVEAPIESPPDDAEFSWATRDFSSQNLTSAVSLSMDEVEAQVADHVKSAVAAGPTPFAFQSQLLLMRTSRAVGALPYANPNDGITRSPFSSIEVRMVPENVTVVPRALVPPGGPLSDEKLVTMHAGESFENMLLNAGVQRSAIMAVDELLAPGRGQQPVADGRRIRLVFTELDGPSGGSVLARLAIYSGETLETAIVLKDDGTYVKLSGTETQERSRRNDDDNPNAMPLYNALYETALKQEIPKPVIDDLVRIFANDVDFQRGVAGGDSFEAFYDKGDEAEGGKNELLFASVTARGETYRYYRFQTPDDGLVDYYDGNGRSTRKFLVRVPMVSFKITSGFGSRFHPILGYTRPHTGVDFAAPIGSPIFSAGNGSVVHAGWTSGYGRRIEVQHANGYITTYNHLSGFARGVTEGTRVRQGQVIGYLGQSGLATGPHLHYEVLVNGHFVDPMRVKLARTREFDGRMLGNFRHERERIDDLLARAPNARAQVAAQK